MNWLEWLWTTIPIDLRPLFSSVEMSYLKSVGGSIALSLLL